MTDNIKPFFITFWSGKALQELLFTGTRWTKPHCAGVTYLLSWGNISSLQFAPELISCDPSTFTFFTLSAISSFPFSWSCDNFTETAGFALLFLLSEPFLTYHQYEHIWPQAIHITQLFLFPNGEHCVSTKKENLNFASVDAIHVRVLMKYIRHVFKNSPSLRLNTSSSTRGTRSVLIWGRSFRSFGLCSQYMLLILFCGWV